MKLAKKTTITVTQQEAVAIGRMTYAARKLWNVCNYERHNHKELGLEKAPDWHSQKKGYKDHFWFKNLPSQTAQEVCKVLDKSWKSFFALRRTRGVQNPKPPRYKQENIPITYMQNGIRHDDDTVRLAVPKALKAYMKREDGVDVQFIYLRNPCFQSVSNIKQIKLYPPEGTEVSVVIVYDIPDVEAKPDNGKYLSIDLGIHNLMTCYDSTDGTSFIIGRKYLSIARKYDKEIGRVQSQWSAVQAQQGVKYPKSSKHIKSLYQKKRDCTNDYLHKITRFLVNYCEERDIHTVVIGDITGIRDGNDLGHVTNQKLHALPYRRIRQLLQYKLALKGISLFAQNEAYTSQCSPCSPSVSKEYANKKNRVHRGLYIENQSVWNADAVGAYSILRLYAGTHCFPLPKQTFIFKVAV